jgi:hypothetical protein
MLKLKHSWLLSYTTCITFRALWLSCELNSMPVFLSDGGESREFPSLNWGRHRCIHPELNHKILSRKCHLGSKLMFLWRYSVEAGSHIPEGHTRLSHCLWENTNPTSLIRPVSINRSLPIRQHGTQTHSWQADCRPTLLDTFQFYRAKTLNPFNRDISLLQAHAARRGAPLWEKASQASSRRH